MSSDSPASTPMALTPQSTGSTDLNASMRGKQRRQTAFYPNVNSSNKPQKPFSRSAAKRASVMALGSIEHLQHYFTKTGIAAKKQNLDKHHRGLVPALGGLSHLDTDEPPSPGLPELLLPPSPPVPVVQHPQFPPMIKTYETNPDTLLPGVVHDLTAVAQVWGIKDDDSQPAHDPALLGSPPNVKPKFDVLANLKTTTNAIRSVRNYVVSLPDESANTIRAQFRPRSLAFSAPVPKRLVSQPNDPTDPLSLIRRSALEVLTVLRRLEESSRLPLEDEAYDAQSDHGSSQGNEHSRVASPVPLPEQFDGDHTRASSPSSHPHLGHVHSVDTETSVAFSIINVQGRSESVLVWEDEQETDHLSDEEHQKKEYWDERLVLGSGWLYKQDILLEHMEKEKSVIARYLDVVDNVLFGGPKEGKRGWEKEGERVAKKMRAEKETKAARRRVSAGTRNTLPEDISSRSGRRIITTGLLDAMASMALTEEPEGTGSVSETESIENEELPDWAKRSLFAEDPLGRAHRMLVSFLPIRLLPALSSPASSRTDFLSSLSSGQLLCIAYNACVRKSNKPWGYINKEAIHDIFALEKATAVQADVEGEEQTETAKRGWTFRRTDNLRLWVGALKLRYLLPIIPIPKAQVPMTTGSSETPLESSTFRISSNEPPIIFDASLVARKEEGWEDMLQNLLMEWVQAVVVERRG